MARPSDRNAPTIRQDPLEPTRRIIAARIRELRQERRWTQAALGKRLGLSQSRLSEIERGEASFTAEQLLEIMKIFNLTISYFANKTEIPPEERREAELQNALARLGATHLVERTDVLAEGPLDAESAILEVLAAGGPPRLVAALGPVVVRHATTLSLSRLSLRAADAGISGRLGWLLENIAEAIEGVRLLRMADRAVVRKAYLLIYVIINKNITKNTTNTNTDIYDIMDNDISSKKTIEQIKIKNSNISNKYNIITSLQVADFSDAISHAFGTSFGT